jgi:hypothetical protein
MKKTKITFIPIDGSGAVHLDFQPGPFGDATEAKKGDGVGFFSQNGELQGVTFDDVNEQRDQQVLEFDNYRVEISVTNGKISVSISLPSAPKKSPRSSKKSTEDAA